MSNLGQYNSTNINVLDLRRKNGPDAAPSINVEGISKNKNIAKTMAALALILGGSYIAFGNEIVDWNSQSETLNQISTELPIALESTVLLNNVSDVTKNEQSDLFNADASYITAGSTSLSETATTEASPTEISKNDHEIPNNNLIETDENSKTLQVSVSAAVESMIHCTESGCTSNDGTILSSKLEDGTRIYIQSL